MADAVRDDFRGSVARHFDYLFAEDGFSFVADMNARFGEYQMQIAASPACQIKFVLEQDAFSVRVGRPAAPRDWSDTIDGIQWWHALAPIMVFEDTRHPELAVNLPPRQGPATLDDSMASFATLLRHYLRRIETAFSAAPPPDWWAGFTAFCAVRYHNDVPLG